MSKDKKVDKSDFADAIRYAYEQIHSIENTHAFILGGLVPGRASPGVPEQNEKRCTCGAKYDRDFPDAHRDWCDLKRKEKV